MRTFRYNEQLETPIRGVHSRVVERTEAEILDEYFMYWSQQMINVGRQDDISEQACIDDWVTVNWAWEVPTIERKPMTQQELERTGQDIRD